MDFIEIRIKNKNQYQREQLIQFFNKLQTMKPFIKVITNRSFQSLIKTFYVNKILNQYKNNNSQKKEQVKQLIQDSFKQALVNKIIHDHC